MSGTFIINKLEIKEKDIYGLWIYKRKKLV